MNFGKLFTNDVIACQQINKIYQYYEFQIHFQPKTILQNACELFFKISK